MTFLFRKPKTLTDTQGTGTFGGDTFNRTSAHRRSIKNIAGEVSMMKKYNYGTVNSLIEATD